MYEFGIYRKGHSGVEEDIIFGYSWNDACRRSKLNPDEWEVTRCEYVD